MNKSKFLDGTPDRMDYLVEDKILSGNPVTLDDIKNQLRQRFLGKDGIHGFGVSHAESAIKMYIDTNAVNKNIIDTVRIAAKPFDIIVVEEERASSQ